MAINTTERTRLSVRHAGRGIASLAVRRPVLATVANLLIVISGLAALLAIEVRELPNIDRPVISVRTSYAGATPETIDKEVTAVIEGAIARTPGIAEVTSRSSAGSSRITVEFAPGTDIDVAANDLRDAIGNLRSLPDDADPPTIVKADADSDPIMRLAVVAPALTIQDLTALVDQRIVDRLAAVDGVADIQVFGARDPVVQIIIDPDRLAARRLSITDLGNALAAVTLDAPAGSISDANRTLLVRADASARTETEIGRIQINDTTRVSDVADVVLGPADRVTALRVNGENGLGMGVIRQAGSNTLEIAANVRRAVDEINATLPPGVDLRVTSDDSVFINGAIREVVTTLAIATLIVVGIIFVFLRSPAITLIPAITVPIALAGTVAAMWLVGFSINILTLLALVLATGLVVDDVIVVIENITRRRAAGLGPRAAAVIGTDQVFFAVIATTATLAAVFIPISFFPGRAGSLFAEFGFVLAFAVTVSSFVALTLGPMLSSRMLAGTPRPPGALSRAIGGLGDALARLYARLLDACLSAPLVVLVIATAFAAAAAVGFRAVPAELTPLEDRGFVPVFIGAPQASTVDYTDAQIRLVEEAARPFVESGEATNMFALAFGSGGGGFLFLTLAPWEERARSQAEITSDLNRRLQAIPGVQVFARRPNSLGIRGGGQGLQFAVVGDDYAVLAEAAETMSRELEDHPAFTRIRVSYDTTQPQMSIRIDRDRVADVGLPLESISTAVQTLLAGREVGTFFVGDDPISIRVRTPRGMIQDVNALDNIQLRTSTGEMIPLSSLVTFEETAVAPNLPRQDQLRAVPVTAGLADGVALQRAVDIATDLARDRLPEGTSITFTGEAEELQTAGAGAAQTFVFALLIVFLVLAAQFESFASAAILIATVPFGLAAAILAILLTGGTLNVYSQIGLVLLVGLMAKNGILIVEFANQLRDAGRSVHEAIREAAVVRLRPVTMTMISTVLGGVPLLLLQGAGSEARGALGWIIVGGLGFATLATLFLTPVVFRLVAPLSRPRAHEGARLADELSAAAALDDSAGQERTPVE